MRVPSCVLFTNIKTALFTSHRTRLREGSAACRGHRPHFKRVRCDVNQKVLMRGRLMEPGMVENGPGGGQPHLYCNAFTELVEVVSEKNVPGEGQWQPFERRLQNVP